MKKNLKYSLFLSSIILSGLSMSQNTAQADQTKTITSLPLYSNLSLQNEFNGRMLNGSFSAFFKYENHWQYKDIGVVNDRTGRIVLSVHNGGPEALEWTAAVYNDTTHQMLADYRRFEHGKNGMIINFDKGVANVGDRLSLMFSNDNFPRDQGFLQVYGSYMTAP